MYFSEPPPNAPKNLEVLFEGGSVIYRWKSTTPTDRLEKYTETYSIEESVDYGKSWNLVTDETNNSQQKWVNFPIGISYQFRVKAHNQFGSSEATAPLQFVRGNN